MKKTYKKRPYYLNKITPYIAVDLIKELSGYQVNWKYEEQNRIGDHICYISDLRKLKNHFPEWTITRSLRDIVREMIKTEEQRNLISNGA